MAMTTENNAAPSGLTDEQRTLIGHAAECLKQGGWAPLALKLRTLLAAAPKAAEQAPVAASSGVITAAEAVIRADRDQALTTGHINALENAIAIQRGTLQAPVDAARDERTVLKRIGYATLHDETIISVRLGEPTPTDFIDGYSGKDVFVLAAPTQQRARASEAGEAVAIPDAIQRDLERTDWTPEEALRFYADGKHFDVVNLRTRILDTGAIASCALKHTNAQYHAMKGADASFPFAPAQQAVALTDAARDVLAERCRQVEQEGWTPEHDDQYQYGQMATAAGCYAMFTQAYPVGDPSKYWPWAVEWWKPTTPRRNLVKAAALILAEIERLDRAALQSNSEGEAR